MNDPNAMAVATVSPTGQPSVRMLLLKEHGPAGFVFYGNLQSRKGQELAANPRAALCFHWRELELQVRVEGAVEQVSDSEADAYFATRPRISQLGAWASEQSRPLDDRATLLARVEQLEERYRDAPVPRPRHWSGYRLIPLRIELWQRAEFRLNDRWEFVRAAPAAPWNVGRLYP